MKTPISESIKNRNYISFDYEEEDGCKTGRVGEPFVFGSRGEENDLQAQVWQTDGFSKSVPMPGWRYFKIGKMSNIKILEKTFNVDRLYNKKTNYNSILIQAFR